MQRKPFGKTGIDISILGYGCGTVGGLMIRGSAADRERAVARSVELGINYFDTAALYGNGVSEEHLGAVWKALKPEACIGTKFSTTMDTDRPTAAGCMDASLGRLDMDQVDLFQLHNPISFHSEPGTLTPDFVVSEVVPEMQALRDAGKTRFIGFTGIGETEAVADVVERGGFDTVQLVFNLLNPTSVYPPPPGFSGQDYQLIAVKAAEAGLGTIGIRIMAAGALSGVMERHPVAIPEIAPIGSGATYADDVAHARRLQPLVDRGYVGSLIEAAVRFAASEPTPNTALLGCSSIDQLEFAASAVQKGPLPDEAMALVVKGG